MDSCHAVDAFVAATAGAAGRAMILTGDPDDPSGLTAGTPGVTVTALV